MNIKTKNFVFILLLFTFLLSVFVTNVIKVNAESTNKQFLRENYSGFFMTNGLFQVFSIKTGKYYPMSDYYLNRDNVVYGTPQDVTTATSFTNEYYPTFANYRFLGLSTTPTMPVAHDNMIEDYDTAGNTGTRNYVNHPYDSSVANNIRNNSLKPSQNDFNHAYRLQNKFIMSGKSYSESDSEEIINDWLYCLDDKYSRNHDWYKAKSSEWINRDTENQFLTKMSAEKRRSISYIAQPPTEIGGGTMVEWHGVNVGGGVTRDLYDVFPILSDCNGDNFIATKLTAKIVNNDLRINFSVKANNDIETDFNLPTKIDIWVNGNYELSYDVAEHGISWKNNESKESFVGSINIEGLQVDSQITIKATFNPNEKDDFTETTYNDNSKTITIVKPREAKVCNAQDYGEKKNYSVRVCSQTNNKGECIATTCSIRSEYLVHKFELLYDENKQELEGLWSSNTKGHDQFKNEVPNATYSIPKSNIWRKKISNHNVPGVKDLKRVLRSGRGLQMYSTINYEFTVESFSGESDLSNKAKKMVDTLINNLNAVGIEVEGSSSGIVKNHLKKAKAPSQIDSDRVLINGKYIEYEKGNITKNPYGDSSCTRIYIHSQTFKMVIPIKTKNEDIKKQETASNGDFKTSTSYDVANSQSTFFTNIDTMNGEHALQFQNIIKFKEVDSASSNEKTCKAKSEKFGIQGNIYDDTRVEDVTEEENGKNNFNF